MNNFQVITHNLLIVTTTLSVLLLPSVEVKAGPWRDHEFKVSIPYDEATITAKGSETVDVDLLIFDSDGNFLLEVDTPNNIATFGKGRWGNFKVEVYCDDYPCEVPVNHSWRH